MPAELVVRTPDLEDAVRVFESVGFRVDMVVPADDPSVIAISGEGLQIRLERGDGPPATIRITADQARTLDVPGGTRIELGPAPPAPEVPPLAATPVVTAARADAWHPGRAGMAYRDLVPGRLGGWLIASHIRIPEGGPVPDYVHHHAVRFQLLVCRAGRVRVLYEDQGEIRDGGGRLHAAAAAHPAPRGRVLAGLRGDRGRVPRRPPDLRRPRARPAHAGPAARP